jgi:SAM-dependent methyltransferase
MSIQLIKDAAPSWSEIYDWYTDLEAPFTAAQVDSLGLQPHQTVLDIGAGSGRLTVPMARKAASVTAIDVLPGLLDRLRQRAQREGIVNVRTANLDWRTIEPARDIERHDVVVASRFDGIEDLMKLDAAANQRVCLLIFSGPSTGALHRALLQGIVAEPVEPPVRQPGFMTIFNELCDLGLDPNVLHLMDGFTRCYANVDEAVEDFAWILPDASFAFNLRRNLEQFLTPDEKGVRFLFRTRSTLLFWDK